MSEPFKYRQCMVLAGGGFRFGIYLGMYAAARQAGRAPDLLLATCGGAMAAAIIQSLPDDEQRKAWLSSPQMYQFWCGLQPSSRAGIARTLAMAARRRLSAGRAPVIPDLFRDYLFEVPQTLPLPAPETTPKPPEVALAIIGAKLLFGADEVARPRAGRKLFAQTVFCEPRAAALLNGIRLHWADSRWGEHAIDETLQTDVTMPLADAVRISVADCYYFACHRHGWHSYTGGMIDLFPIEIAKHLASQTMIEFKQAFDQTFAIPAWRSVLGIDGNQRLRHVHAQFADVWVDSSDVANVLAKEQVQKQLDWRRNRIRLVAPCDYATYVRYMEAQWRYGFQRGLEACQRRPPHDPSTMRQVGRYNRAEA